MAQYYGALRYAADSPLGLKEQAEKQLRQVQRASGRCFLNGEGVCGQVYLMPLGGGVFNNPWAARLEPLRSP